MRLLHTFDEIDWSGVELVEIKYKKVNEKLLDSLDWRVREIVDKMLTYNVDCYDRCMLDVKVRHLDESDFSCALQEYHYDWVRTYEELPTKHETHFIYSNVNGTEFASGTKCCDNSIYTYGRELHRGVVIDKATTRVLIRLTYANNKNIK